MLIIDGRNVNWNYSKSLENITKRGERHTSRVGDVLVAPYPVMTVTKKPVERVLFNRARKANPFFHFFECLWMMSGSDDGTWLDQFVRDFSSRFAETGGRIHGAYGARWRRHFGFDQLDYVTTLLRENHRDRRVVVNMWDPIYDLGAPVADVPCNTQIFPRVLDNDMGEPVLDLTVVCRSNDIVWGAMGANVVHFSFLQEVMAARIGVGVGTLYQLSNNWHVYTSVLEGLLVHEMDSEVRDLYSTDEVCNYPVVQNPDAWFLDLDLFMGEPTGALGRSYQNDFFSRVAEPMMQTHRLWRNSRKVEAMAVSGAIAASDWRRAVQEWMAERTGTGGAS